MFGDSKQPDQHLFRALCQNPKCRAQLGGFHIPAHGGRVVFACYLCGTTSEFKNKLFEIKAAVIGTFKVPTSPAPAPPIPKP